MYNYGFKLGVIMGRPAKYPFSRMNVGGYEKISFKSESLAMKARIAAGVYGCINSMKFRTRVDGNLLEVWRVS